MAPRIVIAALAGLALAGCGPAREPTYHADKTRSCLAEKGARVDEKLDFVASTATGGAFRAVLPDNVVTVAFGESVDDGRQIESAYIRFHAENVGIEDILKRQSNAVLLWKQHPADNDLQTVLACLS